MNFKGFPKIPRWSRDLVVTEKIDGTNGQIVIIDKIANPEETGPFIWDDGCIGILAGSRTRWLTLDQDNFGFARWVAEHGRELLTLGYGHHFGEWYGHGIQRNYGLKEKRFALFNVKKWASHENRPGCCDVVPVIASGALMSASGNLIETSMNLLQTRGSYLVPGFMNPEGVVIYHTAGNILFKKTFKNDEKGKENNG